MNRAKLSIRWKVGLLVVGVACGLSALDVWLIPGRMAQAQEEELYERALVLGRVVGSSLGVAMDLEQPAETLQETLATVLNDKLVRWAALYDITGKKLTAVGDSGAPERRDGLEQLVLADTIFGISSVTSNNHPTAIGSLAVALRSERVGERRAASRKAMALQALGIVAIGLLLAMLATNRIAKSMRSIAHAALQIGRGDISGELNLDLSDDELGEMARAFMVMNTQLRQLQESAVRVAAGDLTGSITGDGELFSAFRNMVQRLGDLATRISTSSSSVATAAAGMFSSVRQHEASAAQQNSALEEIKRTVEALSGSAEQVAEDASMVREMAQRSLVSTQHTAEQTRLVSNHSDRIGEILSLIQNIADKSDLLALNAALEGTKAGEVGRGFSIVAAEMRRLSEHVVDSVRDIRKLVADMHQASHASVLATEDGIKLARETASAATKISEAVARQREGTTQVRTALVEIVGVVNDTLNGSSDTTKGAESLLQLSHELKLTAKNFRVGVNGSSELTHESPG